MTSVLRGINAVAGLTALALGIIGALVPGLPTTVFVLIAAWCFARSVPAWERRLLAHRTLGRGLRRYRDAGGLTRPAKSGVLTAMWTSTAVSVAGLAGATPVARLAVLTGAAVGTLVLLIVVPTVAASGGESRSSCEPLEDLT